MTYQPGCSGCEAISIEDPRERAHRLLDLHIDSGGYYHWADLRRAIVAAYENPKAVVDGQPTGVANE